jgi:PTH1 family peptidyl-tRNA hydrolase
MDSSAIDSGESLFLVVGLGNPGRKYEKTRHNIGFDVLDELFSRFQGTNLQQKFDGRFAKTTHENKNLVMLWPETFMNNSGRSVAAAAKFFKVDLNHTLVICDDLSLAPGRLRLRPKGSSGGQKGLQDIIEQLGSQDVPRLRVGIGATPANWETSNYVLAKFDKSERETVDVAVVRAADAVLRWVSQGMPAAMNHYNRES